MELQLRRQGGRWVASGELFTVAAADLAGLDRLVGAELARRGLLTEGARTRVWMRFDRNGLPEWIRQYSGHYFDRIVEFGPEPGAATDPGES
jgi:hypothetical protein